MKKFALILAIVATSGILLMTSLAAEAGIFASAEQKRQKVDLNARQTMESLLAADPKAQRLFDRAFGYAVFSITKGALIITGGGGRGVAVDTLNDERTYMHMGTGGIGFGIGGQAFQLIMMFEDKITFDNFIRDGWHASSSANAVAGRIGANAEANFTNGFATYQVTDAGLLLQADVAGTRYWRSKKLNIPKALRTAHEVLPGS